MIPLGDENPVKRFAWVTVMLIVGCVWTFVVVQPSANVFDSDGDAQRAEVRFSVDYATIPCELLRGQPLTEIEYFAVFERGVTDRCMAEPIGSAETPDKNIYLSLLYSMFLHGGWLHLGGNMLFLYVFGNNVEDRLGHLRFLAFYLLAGLAGTFGHVLAEPDSALPIVGASGAIAGVMGAYLVLFPKAWVRAWIFVYVGRVPAALFLTGWFVSQFYLSPGSGVAWVAHVAGFVFGAVAGFWFRGRRPGPPPKTNEIATI